MDKPEAVKKSLFGKTLTELKSVAGNLEMPGYSALQIAEWIYGKRAASVGEMTNLSKAFREKLSQQYETGVTPFSKFVCSADGTKKYLFPTKSGKYIEAVFIPEKNRHTLCLSTQVGCKMGCLFCATGRQGFQGNLTAGEILNQLRMIEESSNITNIVYMGMGEPFDNTPEVMKSLEILTSPWGFGFGARRITVSTIGITSGIQTFLDQSNCHLAVSLHSPVEEERRELMPVTKAYPLGTMIEMLKSFETGRQRRISFEYIMFGGLNDTPFHARELARLLNGLRCRINLIRFHPVPGVELLPADERTMVNFRDRLSRKGITTTIRQSRGEDILAACGMLSTKELPGKG